MEFEAFPKVPRLNRDIVITEKIDGTNAAILIDEDGQFRGAQSRKRLIYPGKQKDNAGFAAWAYEHAAELADVLGPGRHFGEWWGAGIQRGYGLENGDKRFSLFNTARWGPEAADVSGTVPRLGVVPELYVGAFSERAIDAELRGLRTFGSRAAPGFNRPEGIIVYHVAANQAFKVTLENDEVPKALAERKR